MLEGPVKQLAQEQLFKARKILHNKHYVALLIFDDKTLIDVAILRGWNGIQISRSCVGASKMPHSEPNQLYPVI